jgi:hypothetical protein
MHDSVVWNLVADFLNYKSDDCTVNDAVSRVTSGKTDSAVEYGVSISVGVPCKRPDVDMDVERRAVALR